MKTPTLSRIITPVLATILAAGAAQAQQQLTTVRIANALARPTFVTAPPGDLNRLFIVEQRGSGNPAVATRADIRILNLADNSINATPFLSVNGLATGNEQGLLGLAFDPNYATNGFFYVYYTVTGGTITVTRYTVSGDPNVANAGSATPVLSQVHANTNHNGGWIGFGPDGYLYLALGDGGGACDSPGNALNMNSLLGKMLRLDVSSLPYTIPPTNPFVGTAGMRGEIWAYGLRNPWRPAFDRETGELYIADVGQDVMEEVNIQPPLIGGRNYGWDCREGTLCSSTSPSNCPTPAICPGCIPLVGPGGVPTAMTDPVWAYLQSGTSHCSVTGGYAYRGCAMPWLQGEYFFADVCSNFIWSFKYTGAPVTSVTTRTTELAVAGFTINAISSFGEDGAGEMYICDQGGGEIYKIVPRCKTNCDGSTLAPILNVNDFSCFINQYAAGSCYANCDGSTSAPVLNVNDFVCYLNSYAVGCTTFR